MFFTLWIDHKWKTICGSQNNGIFDGEIIDRQSG